MRKRPTPMSDEERARVWALAADGVAYKDIAHKLDRPQGTINKVISDGILAGKVTRRNGRWDERKGR
jgi:DNA-directed RNA polymerase specialized sigma24 family protein